MPPPITEHVARSPRHTTFYLACGPQDGPLIVFVHGWPELSISWRHQLAAFGALGFRAVAPDMRGYGRSTVHPRHEDYAIEQSTADMVELIDALGRERAIWVGHDWGTPVVWALAAHHAPRCLGVAGLCVPYMPDGFAPDTLIPLVDRERYPADQYPAGQWEYQRFYEENFERAVATFEADVPATVKALFRRPDPRGASGFSRLANVRRDGGWFGGAARAPDLPRDHTLLTEEDLTRYASALQANGFFGPDAWYMNGAANIAHARRAPDGGRLSMPVLFLHGLHDATCLTVGTRLADPMRAHCADLHEITLPTGHWMAQELPEQVNAGLAGWIARRLPQAWPCALPGQG
jgi:pimeloyl-ACP methyl ester carboxylesterase